MPKRPFNKAAAGHPDLDSRQARFASYLGSVHSSRPILTHALPTCPLCLRPIPPDSRPTRHHLTPRLEGGGSGPVVTLHRICHNAIHARFSEAELARRLNDIEALRAEPAIARFLAWIEDKPPSLHAATRRARSKRGPSRGRMA